jgi:predicted extracellular nuclease
MNIRCIFILSIAITINLLLVNTLSSQTVITQWTFEGDVITPPSQGLGVASLVGGTTATFAAGLPGRAWNTATYPSANTGSKTVGVQFAASTAGASGITFRFDIRHSNTSANTIVVQYSTNGGMTFLDGETFVITPAASGTGDTWYSRSVDLSNIAALDNNPNAVFRVVTAFDPIAGNYLAARSTSTYASSGTLRFDNVTVEGKGIMRITEYMYTGNNDEFVEFTNVGAFPVDMTGWSYSDDARIPGSYNLSGFGVVAPGESVVLSELSPAAFRAAWNLCNNVKVVGPLNIQNLGRNDEVNLYDDNNQLVDRLTYGDNIFSPGSIRTQNISGVVSLAGLGANNILQWSLSALNDAEGSYLSTGGDLGSPGKSTRATVVFDPCPAIGPQMRITEYMYAGVPGEFVEFTNVGNDPIDMTGWSYDDDTRTPGVFDLSGFGTVLPGESVVITEVDPEVFRQSWNLCRCIKILGPYTNSLGRNDEINLFDSEGKLVDRLTYGDQTFAGTIRTQNIAGFPSLSGLGANIIAEWSLASVGDSENSFFSNSGMVGSPGFTNLVSDPLNPCKPKGILRITEFAYAGNNGEYIELTNIGDEIVQTAGWSYSDSARNPGSVDISAFGAIVPGESVILTETAEGSFRAAWNIPMSVKIIGGLSVQNLGRNDEINIYDEKGELVDRLTYGDQVFPGTIRTQNIAGYPNSAGLGSNIIQQWILASVDDAEGSYTSSNGDIGSPGMSLYSNLGFTNVPCCEGLSISCHPVNISVDGDGQAVIDPSIFENNASSDCGLNTVFVSSEIFTCDNIGNNSVIVTAVDVLGNTASCTANVNVSASEDLPTQWSANNVGLANGSSNGAPCGEEDIFTLTANQFTSFTSDNQHFVSQLLCGNGSITTQVNSIEGGGFAGVQFRETLSSGAKKAALKTQLSNFLRREARATTNGVTQSQQIIRPNSTWLRIIRNGNQFSGFSSSNGQDWQFTFASNISMTNCIYAGVFVEGISANSHTTAVFKFTAIDGQQLALPGIDSDFAVAQALEIKEHIRLFPNPAQSELTLQLPKFTQNTLAEVDVVISDASGRIVRKLSVQNSLSTINLEGLQTGMYFIQIPAWSYAEKLIKL